MKYLGPNHTVESEDVMSSGPAPGSHAQNLAMTVLHVLCSLGNGARCARRGPSEPTSGAYRGTSLIRNCTLLGPYSDPRPGPLREFWGWGVFL
jgi:hypothetical protein